MATTILLQDPALGLATCGPVFLNMWYGPVTVPLLDTLAEHQRATMTKERHVVVTLVDPRVGKVMPDEARARAKKISDEIEPLTIALCFVVLGTGFFSAMVRSVVAGIQLFARQRRPWKVLGEIDECLNFVEAQLSIESKTVDREELRAAIQALMAGSVSAATA